MGTIFRACKHCAAYEPDQFQSPPTVGQCRRLPPAMGASDHAEYDLFPLVTAGSWCLEFRPSAEAREQAKTDGVEPEEWYT